MCPLNLCVYFAPVFTLAESIDEFSVFILKEFWRGGDQCLGRGHADESNFLAVERDEFMCLKYRGICLLVDEVASVVPACELWGKFQEAIHTEVEGSSNALRGV